MCGGATPSGGVRVHVGAQPLDQVVRDHRVRLDGGHDHRGVNDLLGQAEVDEVRRVARICAGVPPEVGDGGEQGAASVAANL